MKESARQQVLLAHEALHAASIAFESFSSHVEDHPYVKGDPRLKKEAEKVSDALYQFYSKVAGSTL